MIPQELRDIRQRPQCDDGRLGGPLFDRLMQQLARGHFLRPLSAIEDRRGMAAVLNLPVKREFRLRLAAEGDGDASKAAVSEKAADDPGAIVRPAADGGDGLDVEFGAGKGQSEGESVV